jgi:hypothetical protein
MTQVGSRFHSEGDLQMEIDDSRTLMIWIFVTAITLFCAAVISATAGWSPIVMGHTGASPTPAANVWWGTDKTQSSAAQLHRALLTVPADHTEANETLKTTKG